LLDSEAIRSADVDPRARAETLAPAAFVRLARMLAARRRIPPAAQEQGQ
jgi:16S rRNA (adenine1518-N6/adenine1519-N6)-dimethyltransferase